MEKEEGFYIMNPNKVLGKVLECLGFKRVYRPLLHKTRILCLVKNTFYQFKDIVQLADYMENCPRCGSENIVEWEDRRYHCMDCGKEFKG